MNTSRAGFLFTIKLFQQFAKTTSMKLQTIKSSEDKEYLGLFLTSSVYYWFIKRSHAHCETEMETGSDGDGGSKILLSGSLASSANGYQQLQQCRESLDKLSYLFKTPHQTIIS